MTRHRETLKRPGLLRRTGESERGQIADSESGQIADSEISAIKLWSIYMHAPVAIPCVCPEDITNYAFLNSVGVTKNSCGVYFCIYLIFKLLL